MQPLPIFISLLFLLTTLLTIVFLYKASNYSRVVILLLLIWLGLQALISLSGFYTLVTVQPPRFALLLFPPVVFVIIFFCTKKGRAALDGFKTSTLTLLHIVRIPVELVLYFLYLYKAVPRLITFEGNNFDILCGLTAPLLYYFGYRRPLIGKTVLVAWNVLCLLLLGNVVVTAVLSAPFPIQRFGFEQPNIAMLYFPYVWLPCGIVPVVLFAHLVTLRKLMKTDLGVD